MTRNEYDANRALAERADRRGAACDPEEWHRTWDGIVLSCSVGVWLALIALAVTGYFVNN